MNLEINYDGVRVDDVSLTPDESENVDVLYNYSRNLLVKNPAADFSERVKSIHTFFFRACSLFLQSLWHLIWHLPERCVLGYVLLPNICDVSHTLGTLT